MKSATSASPPHGASILFISFDGMLEPLGASQVLNYLYPLTREGFKFVLLSMEHAQDISAAAVARRSRELQAGGIEWRWDVFKQGRIRQVGSNLRRMFRAARQVCRRGGIGLIHARSYPAASIARLLQITTGIPYLFDLRGYWIDERVAEGQWFTNRVIYSLAKSMERHLVEHAQAIITLTELQAQDFRKFLPSERPVVVIPTCANYDLFTPEADRSDVVPADVLSRLEGKLVVGMVGSINKSYCISESFELFREIAKLRLDAHLLCLTRQTGAMEALLKEHGISESDYTLRTVTYADMPAWLPLMDWALLLLKENFAKRGSMPTKLAEFFASGVRILQYGCNPEVSAKVSEAGSGIVLNNLSQTEMERVARIVASAHVSSEQVLEARNSSRFYLSLENGITKYAHLYSRVK